MNLRNVTGILLLILAASTLKGQDAKAAIQGVLNEQTQAWNRADIEKFVSYYAEDCTFVGKQMVRGRERVLARYRSAYASAAAMGQLRFADLEVQPIDQQVAIVTGKFHLDRTAAAGGPADGIFSLVFRLKNGNWQILLDHTSS